ncbi:hypothetical protein FPZ42_04470 [Mucilaginibacter achroorhodeus]|uniref:Uncharacterized protein n=1 Tax=Mucilaginibacter achroorhodeus TaxID=2599294 RepID=A0A563UAW2_9SPHI|nr:hypothetical protein [Mucilaginibacter achroorhodeus]TWR28480.1 hypothetical protein FPZ42_04470 [Mucilaginibacter achroorhodeus]
MILQPKFKFIGAGLSLVAVTVSIIFRLINFQLNSQLKETLLSLVIIGLGLLAFSKERFEDERILAIRYKCLAGTVLFSTIFTTIFTVANIIFDDILLSGQQLIITTLLIYILLFNLLKRNDNNENID